MKILYAKNFFPSNYEGKYCKYTSSDVILLRVSSFGVPHSVRILVNWSISGKNGHTYYVNTKYNFKIRQL